jgi:uncharacterized protein YdhG (YjbR/CyaY superfamily)
VKTKAPATIDEYIAGFPPDVRRMLQQVRATIHEAVPDAEETISYGIPTFKHVLAFAGWKKHVSVYPAPMGVPQFAKAVAKYGSGRGTLQFPLDEPIPLGLIARLARFRNKAEKAKAKAKIKAKATKKK